MTAQAGGASPPASAADAATCIVQANQSRNELRRQLRNARRALTATYRRHAAIAVARKLGQSAFIKPRARIGIYLALPDELDLQPFIQLAWARHCQLFVPHIHHLQRRRMAFHPLTPDSSLRVHPWGMRQLHRPTTAISSGMLDAVLVPLLGFDVAGNRLGMGAGFYDRYFARLAAARWRRPRLIGVGYACQQVATLKPQPHDVRLDVVLTECGWVRLKRANNL